METELYNFIFVWSTVLTSLCYCHAIGKVFSNGKQRLVSIFPVISLFFILPLQLRSIHFGGISSFLISWLASFKLLLFATGKGPLSIHPHLPLPLFIAFACLPIKAREQEQEQGQEKQEMHENKNPKSNNSTLNYITKIMLLVLCIRVYDYKSYLHPKIVYFFYALHIYFALELTLAVMGAGARAVVGVDLEPQFNEPYLSTSLQDFWGRRWNLMVTNILRQAVYDPVRSFSNSFLCRRTASLAALIATFFVSGLMHELVFYGLGRVTPTGEITCFFVLHGFCVAIEIVLKSMLKGKIRVPGIVSGAMTIGFVIYSSFWLFFPPLLRGEVDVKACKESLAFIEFVKHGRQVSPSNFTCPYFSPAM